jgi:phosphatidylserine decarboxylase
LFILIEMQTVLFKESLDLVVLICFMMFIFKKYNIVFFFCLVILWGLIYFYRLPKRMKPIFDENFITSPSDGKVLKITETKDGMYKITIYLSILDVHIQWYPVDGLIRNIIYRKGEFNLAHILEKSDFNERMTTIIQNKNGIVRVDQIAGQVARRIVNKSISNTYVKRGNQMGMIKLSSRVDIFLPSKKVKLFIHEGDRLYGKTTPIGKWNNDS